MKKLFGFLLIIFVVHPEVIAQFKLHKSEARIARMTPDERVVEYCEEYLHHDYDHDDYQNLLHKYIRQDGPGSLPQIIRFIDMYLPKQVNAKGDERKRGWLFDAASGLLSSIDEGQFRVRAFAEGRKAISALQQSLERMRTAHFDQGGEYESQEQTRYSITLSVVESLEGNNSLDTIIRSTLEFRYDLRITDEELLNYVNYLIAHDPKYPGRREMEVYDKAIHGTKNGKRPRLPVLLKNSEPHYQAYLEYRAKKEEKDTKKKR